MKFELEPYHRNLTEQELLDDLKKVALKLGKGKITSREYNENGKYRADTTAIRFGGWNKALEKASIDITRQQNISEKELFKNIEEVWIKLGRQPRYREFVQPISKYSGTAYENRFGTWRKGLEVFIDFINADEPKEDSEPQETNPLEVPEKEIIKHKTKRNISERLKVQVLMKDGNKCKLCGITVTGDNIHFDHIKPWAKGGETVLENLQVLCAEHNLAKGDLEYLES